MISLPHFLQEQDKTCVPASVRMVLAYLGIDRSELEISAALASQKDGTSVMNIELLSEINWGVVVRTAEVSPYKLKSYLDQGIPVIVAVWTSSLPYWTRDLPHALVIIGYDETNVYLHDAKFPEAPKTVPWNSFLTVWEDFGRFSAIIQKEE